MDFYSVDYNPLLSLFILMLYLVQELANGSTFKLAPMFFFSQHFNFVNFKHSIEFYSEHLHTHPLRF